MCLVLSRSVRHFDVALLWKLFSCVCVCVFVCVCVCACVRACVFFICDFYFIRINCVSNIRQILRTAAFTINAFIPRPLNQATR